MQISGRNYPDRPPGHGSRLAREARLRLVCESLGVAAEHCTEPERRLYKAIREVQAQAENLLATQAAAKLPDPAMWGAEPDRIG